MSPYMFCMSMEIFSSLMEKEVERNQIALIPKCIATNLSHLVFADDLMIFTKVEEHSLVTINWLLEIFTNISGLQVNRDKSSQFFVGLSN